MRARLLPPRLLQTTPSSYSAVLAHDLDPGAGRAHPEARAVGHERPAQLLEAALEVAAGHVLLQRLLRRRRVGAGDLRAQAARLSSSVTADQGASDQPIALWWLGGGGGGYFMASRLQLLIDRRPGRPGRPRGAQAPASCQLRQVASRAARAARRRTPSRISSVSRGAQLGHLSKRSMCRGHDGAPARRQRGRSGRCRRPTGAQGTASAPGGAPRPARPPRARAWSSRSCPARPRSARPGHRLGTRHMRCSCRQLRL